MKQVTEVVRRYLNTPETNYSIQIDGLWGTGKTHYVINQLIPFIESQNIRSNLNTNFKVCYVSLNGISSVDQIGEAVYFGIANPHNKFLVQTIKMLGKYGGALSGVIESIYKVGNPITKLGGDMFVDTTGLIEKKLRDVATNGLSEYVLIFDDLERIADSLNIKEVFGYISSNYLEQQNNKVIFVSNEKEIKDFEIHKKTNEKIIGRKITFNQNSLEVVSNIFANTYDNESVRKFYFEHQQELLHLIQFVMGTSMNLRTIRFVFDIFVQIFEDCKGFSEEEEFEACMKAVFLNALVVSEEFKSGRVKFLDDISFIYETNLHFLVGFRDKNEPETYPQQFNKRYHQKDELFDRYINYFKQVTKFVLEGYMETEQLNEEISSYISEMRKKNNKSLTPFEKLNNFRKYGEAEIADAQKKVLISIRHGEMKIFDYLDYYYFFSFFKENDLILVDEDVESAFREGFPIALERINTSIELELRLKHYTYSKGYALAMIEAIKEKMRGKQERKSKDTLIRFFEHMKNGVFDPDTMNEVEYEKDFFKEMIEQNIIECYLIKSRTATTELSQFLHHKYLRISNAEEFYHHEIPFIDEYQLHIKELISKTPLDKVHLFNLKELINQVQKVRDHLIGNHVTNEQ